MGKFNKQVVDDLANKLLIGLTPEENKMVLDEFEIIDKQINIINNIDGIEKVEPMSYGLDRTIDFLREDKALESTPIDELLANCDVHTDREVEVPKVVG